MIAVWLGDFENAAALIAEDEALKQATGTQIAPYAAMLLAAFQGRDRRSLRADRRHHPRRGRRAARDSASRSHAGRPRILHNGLGRYDERAGGGTSRRPTSHPGSSSPTWALPGADRGGRQERQRPRRPPTRWSGSAATTRRRRPDWALGIEARSRALLSDGRGRGGVLPRGDRAPGPHPAAPGPRPRRICSTASGCAVRTAASDAREQHLRIAHDHLGAMGMEAFAERARHELLATGETVRKRRDDTREQLTPQEEHIARLARDGRTNPEIGAELYLSARTVEWHLRKVFTKLGISSRKGLHDALPVRDRHAASA